MTARVIRYEWSLIIRRLPLFLLLLIGSLAVLAAPSFIPFLGERLPVPKLPEGMTPEQLQVSYQLMLQTLPEGAQERLFLTFFLATNTNQFDYMPLREIASIHAGMETMAIAYSFSEGVSFFSILFGTFLGMVMFAFPFFEKTLYIELSSNIRRKDLFLGKCAVAIVSMIGFHGAVFILCWLLSYPYSGQAFLLLNGGECVASSLLSILFMKTLGAFIGSLFFFSMTVLGSLVFPRPYVAPIFLVGAFVLCFLFSNTRPPEWGYYGMPSGTNRYLLLAMPFSNIILGTNYGFLWESVAVLAAYVSLCGLAMVVSYRRFLRRDI